MEHQIPLSGISSLSHDYESPDGQLDTSVNLISEDGHLHPICPPSVMLALRDGEKPLAVHHASGNSANLILSRPTDTGRLSLWWMQIADNSQISPSRLIGEIPDCSDAAPIGNVVAFATSSGLAYAFWQNGSYTFLAGTVPFIPIQFALAKSDSFYGSPSFIVVDKVFAGDFDDRPGSQQTHASVSRDLKHDFSDQIYPAILKTVDQINKACEFCMPFFVRYAIRLFDGSYVSHSSPVMMLPSIHPPKVTVDSPLAQDDGARVSLRVTPSLNPCKLFFQILPFDASAFSKWKGLVESLDIFVSAPIPTYDLSEDLANLYITEGDLYRQSTFAFSSDRGRPSDSASSSGSSSGSSDDGRPGNMGQGDGNSGSSSGDGSSSDSASSSGTSASSSSGAPVFSGHYGNASADNNVDHFVDSSSTDKVLNVKRNVNLLEDLRQCSLFYKVASIPFDKINPSDCFSKVEMDAPDLSGIQTRPTLPDGYQQHASISPLCLFPFNSRLNCGNISFSPASPNPIRSLMPFASGAVSSPATITVWTRIGGQLSCIRHIASAENAADIICDIASNFPRYVFYPDANAYKMQIEAGGSAFTFSLQPHDRLNGAFYFGSDFALSPLPQQVSPDSFKLPSSVRLPAKIYTSEVNNPFLFPPEGINTVGSGSIVGIKSATQALSQGQFGQFPLYAFCSDGIWALQTNAKGTYTSIQPISRDICLNAGGIVQLDRMVLFPSARGIGVVQGSNIEYLSDSLRGHLLSPPIVPQQTAFEDFISGASFLYDFIRQFIFVYNPSFHISYVYSLRSGQWGMGKISFTDGLNAYPHTFAVIRRDNGHFLSNLSFPDKSSPVPVEFTTRPFSVSSPDSLKSVSSLLIRGTFRHRSLNSILHATRDLIHWHLVRSSPDETLRNMRGTPYKQFRLRCGGLLLPSESIHSISIDYTPRYTHRLH